MTQLELAEEPLNDMERRYREWIDENPRVLDLFRRFAIEAAQHGRRFGFRLIAERVRWEMRMTWEADDRGYKINDHYTPYIARDLMREMPALEDLVETRRVVGEET